MSPDVEKGLREALGATGGLGDSTASMFGPIKSLAESTGRVEQIKQQQAQAQAQADYNASRSFADTTAKQFESMKSARGEMPQRNIEEHTTQGLLGLGALLPMAGAMLGNKGLMSGVGAMQAMTGLLNGYREGNKERIAFEQKKYDDEMRKWESHARQLESDFRNAVEISRANMQAGHDAAKLAAVKAGAPIVAALVDQQGAVKTYEMLKSYNDKVMSSDAALARFKAQEELRQGRETPKEKDVRLERQTAKDYFGGVDLGTKAPTVQNVSRVMGEAADLAKTVEDNPILVGRTGQAREIKQRLFDSINSNKPIPEDLENSTDQNVQDAVLFAKRFASFRTRYEQALAGTGRGFTVALQQQYNKLLDPNQFNPTSFVQLMKDLSSEAANGVTGISPQITYDRLMNFGVDIGERAGFKKVRDGASLLGAKPASSTEGKMGSQSSPYKPSTEDEYNKIPKGEYFIDPDDGKLYRK